MDLRFSELKRNIRFYILLSSFLYSLVVYFAVVKSIVSSQLQIIRLEQIYAFTSLLFLYLTILAGPFCYTFRWFPYRSSYLKARRALGVSVFYFALLHIILAFWGQLGGFEGLFSLSNRYLLAIGIGLIALIILFLLAATSFDKMVEKLSFPKWKLLQRFAYLACILILIHTVMLGSHYQNLSSIVSQITFVALVFLLILEAARFDAFLQTKFSVVPRFGVSLLILISFVASFITFQSSSGSGSIPTLSMHSQYMLLAQQAQDQSSLFQKQNIPGLQGDRTKRFTVSFLHPETVLPNQDTQLTFQVFDAGSGNRVNFFQTVYSYPLHLIIVDNTLTYFNHIHPKLTDNGFEITTQFPKNGLYHLYIDFQPFGAIEQQIGFTLPVGIEQNDTVPFSNYPVDANMTKRFGPYEVSLDTHGVLTSNDMTFGNDKLSFSIKDAKTKKPITTLKPYLSAFGHLTMINEKTYESVHIHPFSPSTPPKNANGGPTVDFLPIGIYGTIKSGIYRAFGEFSTKMGEKFDTDFTVEIK